ncbi:MAG: hypothetical protein AABX55_02800 [Nanoarchaeota archaeon]
MPELIYYNKLTNAENIRELAERVNNKNKRYKLIGLNTVVTSLEIKKSDIVYIPQRDATLRIGNAVKIAEGLTKILTDLKNVNVNEIIDSLEMKTNSFKFNDPKMRTNHLMDQLVYELGVQFYYGKCSYQELGKRIEDHIYVERSITETLQGINRIMKILKHHPRGSDMYNGLIGQIDGLKGKIFSKEETVIRRQLVKLLGSEEE